MKTSTINTLRWTLRALSGIFIVFFLFMFIAEVFFQDNSFNPKSLSTNAILQVSVMVISLIGLGLASWKWELKGGVIALAAFVVLSVINPEVLTFPLLLLYPATALLFIVLWAFDRDSVEKIE